MTIERGVGIVMEIASELFHRAIQLNFVVLRGAGPVALAITEKPQAPVGIPVSMGDPAAQKPDLPGKYRALKPFMVAMKEGMDICFECLGDFLVRIECKHPWCLDLG